ncbi:DEAD/DEAH box helicase [Pelomyxa schiedti]|nr:DEAD/DEAH box helicase [Pelomyxa schiedti]
MTDAASGAGGGAAASATGGSGDLAPTAASPVLVPSEIVGGGGGGGGGGLGLQLSAAPSISIDDADYVEDDCASDEYYECVSDPPSSSPSPATTTCSTTTTSSSSTSTSTSMASSVEEVERGAGASKDQLVSAPMEMTVSINALSSCPSAEQVAGITASIDQVWKLAEVTPRGHQIECLQKLLLDLVGTAVGLRKNYLIQHSPGSGKSLTIAALATLLFKLKIHNCRRFSIILIVNDRVNLDSQLGDTVVNFLRKNSICFFDRPQDTKELLEILKIPQVEISNPKIIISTMQKFSVLEKELRKLHKPYSPDTIAIISDEAHRSHGANLTDRLHGSLTGEARQSNFITYFSFTSTPSAKSLEMFGRRVKGTSLLGPFHTYSVADALHDGVILEFLTNFESITLHKDKTSAEHSSTNIVEAKTKIILSHFLKTMAVVDNPSFQGLGMIVVRSRKLVIAYLNSLRAQIEALPCAQRFGVIGAFSPFSIGDKKLSETDYEVNKEFSRFANASSGIVSVLKRPQSNVRMIIVADKLQTGFDEPRLSALYIDKPLNGSNVIQTLGRLNRTAKGKTQVYTVDFVNDPSEIKAACKIYWGTTLLNYETQFQFLEANLKEVSGRLIEIRPIIEEDKASALDLIQKSTYPNLMQDITIYLQLCDRLQTEAHPLLKYPFLSNLRRTVMDSVSKESAASPQTVSPTSSASGKKRSQKSKKVTEHVEFVIPEPEEPKSPELPEGFLYRVYGAPNPVDVPLAGTKRPNLDQVPGGMAPKKNRGTAVAAQGLPLSASLQLLHDLSQALNTGKPVLPVLNSMSTALKASKMVFDNLDEFKQCIFLLSSCVPREDISEIVLVNIYLLAKFHEKRFLCDMTAASHLLEIVKPLFSKGNLRIQTAAFRAIAGICLHNGPVSQKVVQMGFLKLGVSILIKRSDIMLCRSVLAAFGTILSDGVQFYESDS